MFTLRLWFFASLVFAAKALAAPTLGERQDPSFCSPSIAGKKIEIQSPSNSSLVWALGDCTNPGCVQIYWAFKGVSSPDFTSWFAEGASGSTPPLEISTAANRGGFCINVPSFGTTLGGSDCSAGQVTQEFQFKCETCSSATAPIGTSCQVESWDWGQCVTSNGLGEDLSLTSCDSSSSNQSWNLVAV